MVKTSQKSEQNPITENKHAMQTANALRQNRNTSNLRNRFAGSFVARVAFACAESSPAMRMRQHAEQADAAAATL